MQELDWTVAQTMQNMMQILKRKTEIEQNENEIEMLLL